MDPWKDTGCVFCTAEKRTAIYNNNERQHSSTIPYSLLPVDSNRGIRSPVFTGDPWSLGKRARQQEERKGTGDTGFKGAKLTVTQREKESMIFL